MTIERMVNGISLKFTLTEQELFKAYQEQKEEMLSTFALSFLLDYPSFPCDKKDEFVSSFIHAMSKIDSREEYECAKEILRSNFPEVIASDISHSREKL